MSAREPLDLYGIASRAELLATPQVIKGDVTALVAEVRKLRADVSRLATDAGQLQAERDQLAGRLDGEAWERITRERDEAHAAGRKAAADAIEQMPYELGSEGWAALEAQADAAGYPIEWVRSRRRKDDFTTATIGAAYQYGYRQAAKVARGCASAPRRDDARAEVERLTAQLDAIRALHTDSPAGVCPSCGRIGAVSDTDDGLVDYPCPTLRAMGIEDAGPSRPGPLAGYTVRPLPPVPDSMYAPGAIPVGRAVIVDPDNPEAVERELRRVAAETGEPYEIVRDLYDAMGACADEERIEREGEELAATTFETVDVEHLRWWSLRGPTGAVALTAVIVPTNAPTLSSVVLDKAGARLLPDCVTVHRPGRVKDCPARPDGCGGFHEAMTGARQALESWAATGHDDDVIRDALVDVYRRELLAGESR